MTVSKEEYKQDALLLRQQISTFLNKYYLATMDEIAPVANFSDTPDDQQLHHEAHQLIEKLLDAVDLLNTLRSTPSVPHKLVYNADDQQYHEDDANGVPVHAGYQYEVLIPENEYEPAFWARDQVEYNEFDGWYIIRKPNLRLDDLMVRYRPNL